LKVFADVAADTMRKVGMNVDEQAMDSGTWFRRILSRKPPGEGGWSAFCGNGQGTDRLTPAVQRALLNPGFPVSEKIRALRDQWLEARDVTAQRQIAAEIQAQAFIDVPYYPLGTYYTSTAIRSNLTGVLDGQAIFWNVRRQG
jgi:peptide/nickel transport system substrate-binding protein